MKLKLFRNTVKMKRYTGSLLLLFFISLASCNRESGADEAGAGESNPQTGDSVITTQIKVTDLHGQWRIVSVDGKDLRNDENYKGIRHTFLPDGTWLLSNQVSDGDSTLAGVGGGVWLFNQKENTLSTINLPDSTVTVALVVNISDGKLVLKSKETNRTFEWIRVN
jgi:hypothetical protein